MIDIGPSISGLREQTEALAIQATTMAHPRDISPEAKASFFDSINTVKAMVEEKLEAMEVAKNMAKPQPFEADEIMQDYRALNSLKFKLSCLLYPYHTPVQRLIRFISGERVLFRFVTVDDTTTIREFKDIVAKTLKVPAESLSVSVHGSVYGSILKGEHEFLSLSLDQEIILINATN